MNAELTIHPLALKFPELPPKEFEELKKSIADLGLLEAIVINSSNQILDGRHRHKACVELGIDPHTVLWTATSRYAKGGITEAEFIFAANFHRRHLTDDQRLQIRTAFFALIKEETTKAQEESLSKAREAKAEKTADSKSSPQKRDLKTKHERSAIGKLAKQAETTEYKAKQAVQIENVPDLAEAVRKGELTRPEAIKKIKERKSLQNAQQENLPLDQTNGEKPAEKQGPKLLSPEQLTHKVNRWCETHLAKFFQSLHKDQWEQVAEMITGDLMEVKKGFWHDVAKDPTTESASSEEKFRPRNENTPPE